MTDEKAKVLEGYLEILNEKQIDMEMKLIESAVGIAQAMSADEQAARAEQFDHILAYLERIEMAAELATERSIEEDFYDEEVEEVEEDEDAA